jgi:hypothetical protein
MKTDVLCSRMGRWAWLVCLVLLSGGTTLLNAGCDTELSTTVLSSLNEVTNTLVDAGFEMLANQMEDSIATSTSTTTTTDTTDTTSKGI